MDMDRKFLDYVMTELAKKRPLFHSEADFQFSLAWKIKELEKEKNFDIRLEYPFEKYECGYGHEYECKCPCKCDYKRQCSMDILVIDKNNGISYPIEVKYKKSAPQEKTIPVVVHEERFYLKQGANDEGRYDYVRDIYRIENFLNNSHPKGFAIILTNVSAYYDKPSSDRNNNNNSFLIYHGKELKGLMEWNEPEKKTDKKRPPIKLIEKYNMCWKDYSNIEEYIENIDDIGKAWCNFRYLITEINKPEQTTA